MNIPIFQVDAFTDKMFSGNPAAVCLLEEWLTENQMQAIAAENNLSETAFLVPQGDDYALRWFTPQCEVRLCGHATLASAFVIFTFVQPGKTSVRFDTRSGILAVERRHDLLVLDFPAAMPAVCDGPAALAQGLKDTPEVVLRTDDNYFAVYASEREVRALQPDSLALKLLHRRRDRPRRLHGFRFPLFRSQLSHYGRPSNRLDPLQPGPLLVRSPRENAAAWQASVEPRRRSSLRAAG